ncbi:low-density lipoprotein receptor-related protein 12-like [Littorina saxatilis]|uniref:CUB domain-containing protein n=1 Tax=Littorina saxatilis TaxID=31220 RepID=A0AAN9GNF8_9CAEN
MDSIGHRMLCVAAVACLIRATGALTAVYLPTSCGADISVTSSVQLESGTGLTYTNNMDCNITFTVASPYLVLASIERFELEPQRSGTCIDYVNLHDGADVSSSTLNTDVMCGSSLTNTSYITTGQQMTLHFVTDSSAVYLGFNIIFTVASLSPCAGGQYTCNNTYCTPSSVTCDSYDQCGDNSDEDNCTSIASSSSTNWTPLIVGLTLGLLVCLLVAAFAVYRRHRLKRYKKFQHEHIDREDIPDPDPSYPVTHKYFRGIRGQHPDISSYRATEDSKEKQLQGNDEKTAET